MRKILILSMLFFSIHLNAQTDSSQFESDSIEIKTVQLPDSTAIGAPDGKLVSKQIDSSGGEIISDDGRVELIFPAGALAAPTTISIQPIVNLIPNGNGKSYRFEPSGIRFAQPVELIFYYSASEDAVCPALFHFMGLQGLDGKWQYLDYDDWDSANKKLIAHIYHFTAMIDGNEVMLSPSSSELKVGKTEALSLEKVEAKDKKSQSSQEEGDILPPMPIALGLSENKKTRWSVNDVKNGNEYVGKINPESSNRALAEYVAPPSLPYPTSVTIKLNVYITIQREEKKILKGHKGQGFSTSTPQPQQTRVNLATLIANVQLYDEYKVDVSMDFGKGTNMEWTDNSSFDLKIGRRVDIDEIQNSLLKVAMRGKCQPIYINEATCRGAIDVNEIEAFTINKPRPGGRAPYVEIAFKTKSGADLPRFDFHPCPHAEAVTPPFFGTAFPYRISFEAKNESQILSLGKGFGKVVKNRDPNDITATIEPVRD
jgi:hypothetical protein